MVPFVAVCCVFAAVLLAGLTRLATATVIQARADAAADAAALAAAEELALGHGEAAAREAAEAVAAMNGGARLERCDCTGTHAEVVVRLQSPAPLRGLVPAVLGHARAEVDLTLEE